jgi:hypothetical protein
MEQKIKDALENAIAIQKTASERIWVIIQSIDKLAEHYNFGELRMASDTLDKLYDSLKVGMDDIQTRLDAEREEAE